MTGKRWLHTLVAGWIFSVLGACGSDPSPRAVTPRAAHRTKKAAAATKPLTPEQLRRVMNGKATAMAGCYEISESKNRSQTGALTVEFEVGMDGRVSGEHVTESSLTDGVLSDCVLGVVHKARFPKASEPTDVSWPVRFRGGE